MKTETYTDPAAFLAAVQGKKHRRPAKAAREARPDLPRASAGEGDRLAQLGRIARYGYSPRWDAATGFSFWNVRTGARTTAHAAYAAACVAAEREVGL